MSEDGWPPCHLIATDRSHDDEDCRVEGNVLTVIWENTRAIIRATFKATERPRNGLRLDGLDRLFWCLIDTIVKDVFFYFLRFVF
jgi:hypothetical protein